jgi:hypothetical protein
MSRITTDFERLVESALRLSGSAGSDALKTSA